MSVNQSHADAWSLIGNLHMSKCEWAPAQKKFEYILKLPEYRDDPYSFVALGNIWLETLSSIHRKKEKVYVILIQFHYAIACASFKLFILLV